MEYAVKPRVFDSDFGTTSPHITHFTQPFDLPPLIVRLPDEGLLGEFCPDDSVRVETPDARLCFITPFRTVQCCVCAELTTPNQQNQLGRHAYASGDLVW